VRPLDPADLDHIVAHASALSALSDARLFLTGGTGFFGTWLLEALGHAERRLGLGLHVRVVSRNPQAFLEKAPHLREQAWLSWQTGDVLSLEPEAAPTYTHVIHGATAASAALNEASPRVMFETIVEGTRRTLRVAAAAKAKRVLCISSGAVYGRQPPELTHVPETYLGGPDPLDLRAAYAEGKRASEWLCTAAAKEHGFELSVARCFAFVGPHLPLDAHFAIGNFLGDGLHRRAIQILGDGTPRRSYLYASDLVIWLLELLVRGEPGMAYNVGSEHDVSIAETARAVCDHFGGEFHVAKVPSGAPAERYVPSTARARSRLGLVQRVSFAEAIAKTARYHRP
jgi:dTDP-glucose 4,6-dehydratase